MPGLPPSRPTQQAGLVISDKLGASDGWGARDAASSSPALALSVWRVALAVCWAPEKADSGSTMVPAYLVDYVVQRSDYAL